MFGSKQFMVQKKQSEFRETVKTVFYAVLVALVIRTFAFEPFNIPSGSMILISLLGIIFLYQSMPMGIAVIPCRFHPLFSMGVLVSRGLSVVILLYSSIRRTSPRITSSAS